jgi:hypothetical protein
MPTPLYVVNSQEPEAQSIFRYNDELDAIVAYYNTLASNYSAYKAGTITGFTVDILDHNYQVYSHYYEKR